MCAAEGHGEEGLFSPGQSQRASRSSLALCLLVDFPDKFVTCPWVGSICHSVLTSRMSCRTQQSEGGLEPLEADDSAEQAPIGTEPQSEPDAEIAAVLARAAKCIRLEWSPRGRPLLLPEHGTPAPLPSPPSRRVQPGGIQRFPRWRERSVLGENAAVLQVEIATLLEKDAI